MGVGAIVAGAGAGFMVGGPIGAAVGGAAAHFATREPAVVVVPPANRIEVPEIVLTTPAPGGPGPVYAPNDVLNPDLPFTPGYMGYGDDATAQPSHARTIFTGLVLIGGIVYFMGGFDRFLRRL